MLTIGLSAVLIVTLIILFACISENINLKMEVEELKRQNEIQRFKYSSIYLKYSSIYREYVRLLMEPGTLKSTTPDIKEAVHYAMVKAHPDNGGKQEDFVKFRKLYERMNNEYR